MLPDALWPIRTQFMALTPDLRPPDPDAPLSTVALPPVPVDVPELPPLLDPLPTYTHRPVASPPAQFL
ncbi:hypothetical protein D769_28942 [Cupriavidus sp. HMR-1]|nr:hypothetical protein D769_28942 [Cupriavidus sp. HMR-1]